MTEAVHKRDGRIFLQLWHVGRISHPSLHREDALPVALSAIRPEGKLWAGSGTVAFETPRALETAEIPGLLESYRAAGADARAGGFDGVEIHAANGYLLDQFLRGKTNRRTDHYGGSIENRARLVLEVTEAAIGEWGADRVGIRFSPTHPFNDIGDSKPAATFGHVVSQLNSLGLAYLHSVEPAPSDSIPAGPKARRPLFPPALARTADRQSRL